MKSFGASPRALSYLEGASNGRKSVKDIRIAPVPSLIPEPQLRRKGEA